MKKFLLLLALAVAFAGTNSFAANPATAADYASSYKLRPTDILTLSIFQENDINNLPLRIGADGYITMPLVGRVYVDGLTLGQARERITELYQKDFFTNPQVVLFISEYAKQSCYITGQVNRPSEFVFPIEEGDKMTITKVIAGSGGFTTRANRRSVLVKRKLPDGREQVYDINVRNILRDSNAADFPIISGDVIEVQEDAI